MRRPATAVAALLLAAAGTAACSQGDADARPDLRVTGAYVRQPPMPDMAAGYLVVHNSGARADKLVAATSDISDDVQLHTTEGGTMKRVESMTVPARGRLTLRLGGDHLMLMDLKRRPQVGDTVTFTLRFESAPAVTVRAPVEPTDHRPDPHADHGDDHGDGHGDEHEHGHGHG